MMQQRKGKNITGLHCLNSVNMEVAYPAAIHKFTVYGTPVSWR